MDRSAPIVVDVVKREKKNRPPPVPGAGGREASSCYIESSVLGAIEGHCRGLAEKKLEAMGFLVGEVYLWDGTEYCVVREAVTGVLKSTGVSVRFDTADMDTLLRALEGLDDDVIIVGWYHSHPGYGCFMSETDIATQREMFPERFHIAIVLDPVSGEMKAYGLNKMRDPEERIFEILD